MGIELTTKETGTKKTYFDGYCEQAVDSDINLPDYCPDIMRILKCTVEADIINSKIVGDRASADGNAKITVIYSDEKNCICSYKTDYPFSKYAELSSASDSAQLICTAKTNYVNCRAVSKRRIDIHGAVSVHFRVCGTSCEKIISAASGEGIQLKKKGIDISSTAASAVKSFQLSSVEEIGDNMSGIGKIISCFSAPLISETKIIKGKLLIKGELTARILYCSDSGESETFVLGCSLPFSEIVEAADFTDSCQTDIRLYVTQFNAEPKVDNDGEYRYMNVSAEVCAEVTAYEEMSINAVTDAYSTRTEIDAKYTLAEFRKIAADIRDGFSCRQSIDISSLRPKKIYASTISKPEFRCSFSDGKMNINGKIPLTMIVTGEDDVPVSCEREAEFEYSHPIACDCTAAAGSPSVAVSGFSCTLAGGNAEFKAELSISAMIFSAMREKVLTSLSIPEGNPRKQKKSSLTVCFCSGDEKLWDIARHYNTTVEEIMEENGLTADSLENRTMLMIPIK